MPQLADDSPNLEQLRRELAAFAADRRAMDRAEEIAARALGVPLGSFDARALLADAVAEAWDGALEASDESIARRLAREVRRRAKREVRRRRKLSSWSDEHDGLGVVHEAAERGEHLARVAVLADIMPRLRRRLADDREALALLSIYERGIVQRAEVLAETKMSTRAYRNANERIGYAARCLVNRLPDDERERLAQVTPLRRAA